MDLCSLSFSVCVMIVCLLGAAHCSNSDNSNCPCSEIAPIPLTKPPPETCFKSTFRYTCEDGYVRKVGTSSLIKCKQNNGVLQWTKPSLNCIPDPKRTTTQPPESTVTKGVTDIPQDFNITTTITPASTSLQLTQSGSISASGATETNRAEPTSPGVQSAHSQDFVKETKATDRTTSTSTTIEPFDNRTVNPHVSNSTEHILGKTTAVVIICVSLVIICVFIGISYLCYRR
ncbi:interleukin-15 receptor subunit alpha [Xiphias gladius]|uniref:interleukin-15 receptor subunit alpha n=1 Tax=Xiphias gladius TaxID=8245 RepID=UPI001A999020|nr:interleukin-15 receptor subunit alpha [Xiphias gladius]